MTTNPSNSSAFSDDALIRIAEELGIDIPEQPVEDSRIRISMEKFDSMKRSGAITPMGGGFIKKGHNVWQLEREGNEYFLKRMEDEKV